MVIQFFNKKYFESVAENIWEHFVLQETKNLEGHKLSDWIGCFLCVIVTFLSQYFMFYDG